ncbi:NOT2/NOT3/NOT5 family protein [Phlyctema vagabunda]|uniref:NOT2/NOT3/NOT5 family protein n=1 Tax=Phlyctema vagabunda TaxID=108571 RepID=A0ABR4P1X1_9HELO
MGSAGLQNNRPNNGPMASFAQAMGGSAQPATQLDLSEFPSLSNHPAQQSLGSNQSTWATAGARGLGPANNRLQHSGLTSAQQINAQAQSHQQQEDLFNSSSQIPNSQSGFRFGGQSAVGQSSQAQPSTTEEFPPLGRNGNGELGQDRASSLMQNAAFGAPPNGMGFGANNQSQQNRNNGLLNALSGNSRITTANRVASPGSISGMSTSRSPIDAPRQGLSGVPENDTGPFNSSHFGTSNRDENATQSTMNLAGARSDGPMQGDSSIPRSQTLDSGIGSSQSNDESGPDVQDPLIGMSDIDRWGLKGLSYMMNNYPDYAALVTGTEFANMGLDLETRDPISTQIYSLFDSEPPRPAVPAYTNPECYRVHNVATIETKLSNFNDESLLFMFYSNPNDVQQILAAQELNNRNWRFHKKLGLWLTKDVEMQPQPLTSDAERGYYIFFDTKLWQRERREYTLKYSDLESLPNIGLERS